MMHAQSLGVYRQVKGCPVDRLPMPYLQLKVDDHVGGVQIGVESDNHYQIDTSFTVSPQTYLGSEPVGASGAKHIKQAAASA